MRARRLTVCSRTYAGSRVDESAALREKLRKEWEARPNDNSDKRWAGLLREIEQAKVDPGRAPSSGRDSHN